MIFDNKLGLKNDAELARAEKRIDDREIYLERIDQSYAYEGRAEFKAENLKQTRDPDPFGPERSGL